MRTIILALLFWLPSVPQAQFFNASRLCLAKNIYHEARGESYRGKLAVAKVTLNRVNSARFPSSICGVVYQPNQFSWTSERGLRVIESGAWQEALSIADLALSTDLVELGVFEALYFHRKDLNFRYKHRKIVAVIGNHIFYA